MIATGALLLAFLTVQRLVELRIAHVNTARLLARGAREVGADHYPLMVGFHALWLGAMWWIGWDRPAVLFWVLVYAALQVFRIWILWSLGPRWTTRIIVIDEPLVRRGPYRWLRHPNYWLVVAEIATVPLALGAPWAALAFSIVHAVVLWVRIGAENRVLATIRARKD